MTDAKYFSSTKKGEIPELKADLNSLKEEKRKDAAKKVIALMTVGKDVSMLFTDVLKCITTTNLELKKLVYLYVMNYAKNNEDNAILAVNTFHQDCSDVNPLVRALAIRTMGCLRVEKIVEYLCEPLRSCLKDPDPYVVKTAAICVAKLYDMNPQLVETQGFLDMLRELLGDSNPMVVANAVAALCEIDEVSSEAVFTINRTNLSKLVNALEECTEWGQVFILNSLAKYNPKDGKEAQSIADRVTPRMNHANSAVVLAAVKVLMKYLDLVETKEAAKELTVKMRPPLITLLSKEPEIQYVALRNINLILQKQPTILQNEVTVFFCKYNDPIYVKMEKLEIMIMLVNEKNIDTVLLELKEYAMKVDVEFVRKAVRAVGRCAIKLEKAAEKCVHVLLDLIKFTKTNYVVQEAIIVVKDIFRRYPNQYLSIISTLCQNLDNLDEPEAKASMVWIIGEYADRIDTANTLLEKFLVNFQEESTAVQLQLLTAVVKLFLYKPTPETHKMVQDMLNIATTEIDNPDIRDRGFVYWRLLAEYPAAAKQVVLSQKPLIRDDIQSLDPHVLDELIENISSLASVYHKPPSSFVARLKQRERLRPEDDLDQGDNDESGLIQNEGPGDTGRTGSLVGDLIGTGSFGTPSALTTPPPLPTRQNLTTLVQPTTENASGLQIDGAFVMRESMNTYNLTLETVFTNKNPSQPLGPFLVKFKQNPLQIQPVTAVPFESLAPGQSAQCSLQCTFGTTPAPSAATDAVSPIQAALRLNNSVTVFFPVPLALHTFFVNEGRLEKEEYLRTWRSISAEASEEISGLPSSDVSALQPKLEANKVFFVAQRNAEGHDFLYLSARTLDGSAFLMELAITSPTTCKLCTKTLALGFVPALVQSMKIILTQ